MYVVENEDEKFHASSLFRNIPAIMNNFVHFFIFYYLLKKRECSKRCLLIS
jgi:hypothetical protein